MSSDSTNFPPIRVQLRNGTSAITRLIGPADGVALTRGLARLSPTGHAYRFLQYRSGFSEAELHYLTHCDQIDHFALILAILDDADREIDQVGVARCIRDKKDPELAEVAIVVVDEWQRQSGGQALLRHLARLALDAGIRRWQALSREDNPAAAKTLAHFGKEISRRQLGFSTVETTYELNSPETL